VGRSGSAVARAVGARWGRVDIGAVDLLVYRHRVLPIHIRHRPRWPRRKSQREGRAALGRRLAGRWLRRGGGGGCLATAWQRGKVLLHHRPDSQCLYTGRIHGAPAPSLAAPDARATRPAGKLLSPSMEKKSKEGIRWEFIDHRACGGVWTRETTMRHLPPFPAQFSSADVAPLRPSSGDAPRARTSPLHHRPRADPPWWRRGAATGLEPTAGAWSMG
jgi:hypothetical protein